MLASQVAVDLGMASALAQPPYAVAGRRVPPRGTRTDEAFTAVVATLRARFPRDHWCPAAAPTGQGWPAGRPPRRGATPSSASRSPAATGRPPSRQDELSAVQVPTLIIQGERDPFGIPVPPALGVLVRVAGDHSLKKDHPRIAAALCDWLTDRLSPVS
ncbi:hypothetical protein [Tessaracoccus coleopterorum]|uniref:hypothetical protein n=1 Tax=Tessaracoccus coleopterorum TaxID=2714950 RepID=UPI0018D394E7|nr:hypothetical protein [Tessaracoccus coleopterorum]